MSASSSCTSLPSLWCCGGRQWSLGGVLSFGLSRLDLLIPVGLKSLSRRRFLEFYQPSRYFFNKFRRKFERTEGSKIFFGLPECYDGSCLEYYRVWRKILSKIALPTLRYLPYHENKAYPKNDPIPAMGSFVSVHPFHSISRSGLWQALHFDAIQSGPLSLADLPPRRRPFKSPQSTLHSPVLRCDPVSCVRPRTPRRSRVAVSPSKSRG